MVLGRWHWVPDLFCHFVAHYAVAALILAIAMVRIRRFGWATVAAGLLALHVSGLSHYLLSEPESERIAGEEEIIRLLQFNTRHQAANHEQVMRWLSGELHRLDVIVLMEIDDTWKEYLNVLQCDFPHGGWRFTVDDNGISLFTRLHARRFTMQVLGSDILPTLALGMRTSRAATPFVVYATHPRSPVSASKWASRNRQMEAVAHAIQRDPAPHVILLADLNTTVWSHAFRQLTASTGLRDAQAGRGFRETWVRSGLPAWLGIPIDHTLISSRIRVLKREFGPRLGSDHRPIITTVSLPVRTAGVASAYDG